MQSQLNLDLHQEPHQFHDLLGRIQVSATGEFAENHLPTELQLEFLPLNGAMPQSEVRARDHGQTQYVRAVLQAR
jgi:hypothetical protein